MSGGTTLSSDVLVIGGGMAGAWAALGAARAGAQVTLVVKGCCGTSGIAASAGPGHWWVPPEARDEVVRQRAVVGAGLAEPACMHRILDVGGLRTLWHRSEPARRSGCRATRSGRRGRGPGQRPAGRLSPRFRLGRVARRPPLPEPALAHGRSLRAWKRRMKSLVN